MFSSIGNCFVVINIRLSLILIDFLLNVRCMYFGIGNELLVEFDCICVSLQYIIYFVLNQVIEEDVIQLIVFVRIWCDQLCVSISL